MTIAIDARVAGPAQPGLNRYVTGLLAGMEGNRPGNMEVVGYHPDPDRMKASHAAFPWRQLAGSPFSITGSIRMGLRARRDGVELLHVPWVTPWVPIPGPRLVVTVHDLTPIRYPDLASLKARIGFPIALRSVLRRAAHVIAISQATADDLVAWSGWNPDRVSVIPLAADGMVEAGDSGAASTRDDGRGPYALYVGTDRPHKNLDRLLEAWQRMNADGTTNGWTLVLAGRFERYGRLERLAIDVPGVELCRDVSDATLDGLYRHASLFVFPSLAEGFGLPVLEAMHRRLPIACSNAGSLAEVCGRAARLFDPTDTDQLVDSMAAFISSPALREEYAGRSVRRAADFSWERTAQETLAVYHRVLNSASPGHR